MLIASSCNAQLMQDSLAGCTLDGFGRVQWLIHPMIGAETDHVADGEVETSIPVDDDQNVEDQLGDPEDEWEVCGAFGAVEELSEPMKAKKSVKADDDGARHSIGRATLRHESIGQVGGQHTQQVQLEGETGQIMSSQLATVSH